MLTLASDDSAAGIQAGNGASTDPAISDDGRWVAFATAATDIVTGGGAPSNDVVARDINTGVTSLVSNQAGALGTGGNGSSRDPKIAGAPGGAINVEIAYNSDATNVAPAGQDTSAVESVYVRRFSGNTSELVSRADRRRRRERGQPRARRRDLRRRRDRRVRLRRRQSRRRRGLLRRLRPRRRRRHDDPRLGRQRVRGPPLALRRRRRSSPGSTARAGSRPTAIATSSASSPARCPAAPPSTCRARPDRRRSSRRSTATDSPETGMRTISADGRYVVFAGYSTHLPGNENGSGQVYRRDTLTGALELVSRTDDGRAGGRRQLRARRSAPTARASRSRRSRSSSRRTPTASGRSTVRDLAAGTTTLVSRADGPDGALPDAHAGAPRISAGGRHVAFVSDGRRTSARPAATSTSTCATSRRGARSWSTARPTARSRNGGRPAPSRCPATGGWSRSRRTRTTSTRRTPAPSTLRDVYVRDTVAGTTTLVVAPQRSRRREGDRRVLRRRAERRRSRRRVRRGRRDARARGRRLGRQSSSSSCATSPTGQNALGSRAPSRRARGRRRRRIRASTATAPWSRSPRPATNLRGRRRRRRPPRRVRAHDGDRRASAGRRRSASPAATPQNRATSPVAERRRQCLAFHALRPQPVHRRGGRLPHRRTSSSISGACPKPLPVAGGAPQPGAGPALRGRRSAARRCSASASASAASATKRRVLAAARAKAGTAFRFRLSDARRRDDHDPAARRRAALGRLVPQADAAGCASGRRACATSRRGALVRGGLAAGATASRSAGGSGARR